MGSQTQLPFLTFESPMAIKIYTYNWNTKAHICFHSKRPHNITDMTDNMDITLEGSNSN